MLCTSAPPFFFFNDTATTEIYTLSLHDALPISAAAEFRVRQHAGQKRAIGGYAYDLDVAKRLVQPISRFAARFAPGNDFAEHGIVEGRDFIAGVDADIEPQTGSGIGPVQVRDAADARQIPALRILAVQTRLHA